MKNDIQELDSKYKISPLKQFAMMIARLMAVPFVFIFYRILNRSRAIGLHNVPRQGGVIFASNHVSGIDTFLVPYYSVHRFFLMPYLAPAKQELFKVPVIKYFLPLLGSFPVKRRARDFESMNRIAYYAKNYNVMIFPEGTRTKTGGLQRGRSGVGWIIYHSKPKVIPTLVINTEKFFWPGRKRPWFGIPYVIVFDKPLDLTRFYEMPDNKETSQAIADELMRAIADLKEKNKEQYMS